MTIGTVTICTINHMEQKSDTETDSHVLVKKYPLCMEPETPLPHTHNDSFTIPIVGQ
jgi:hypothetical protein